MVWHCRQEFHECDSVRECRSTVTRDLKKSLVISARLNDLDDANVLTNTAMTAQLLQVDQKQNATQKVIVRGGGLMNHPREVVKSESDVAPESLSEVSQEASQKSHIPNGRALWVFRPYELGHGRAEIKSEARKGLELPRRPLLDSNALLHALHEMRNTPGFQALQPVTMKFVKGGRQWEGLISKDYGRFPCNCFRSKPNPNAPDSDYDKGFYKQPPCYVIDETWILKSFTISYKTSVTRKYEFGREAGKMDSWRVNGATKTLDEVLVDIMTLESRHKFVLIDRFEMSLKSRKVIFHKPGSPQCVGEIGKLKSA